MKVLGAVPKIAGRILKRESKNRIKKCHLYTACLLLICVSFFSGSFLSVIASCLPEYCCNHDQTWVCRPEYNVLLLNVHMLMMRVCEIVVVKSIESTFTAQGLLGWNYPFVSRLLLIFIICYLFWIARLYLLYLFGCPDSSKFYN